MATYLKLLCVIAVLGILVCNIVLVIVINDYIRTLSEWINEERRKK